MNNTRISIIVPVYNAAHYIASTIATVRVQTYTDWELILVDDCSTDDSVRVIEAAIAEAEAMDTAETAAEVAATAEVPTATSAAGQGVIRLLRQPQNGGAARARNTGVDAATGRYIAFLDADDVWLPDKLARELAFLQARQAGFVFTSYQFGDEQAVPTGKAVHVPATLTYREALSRTVIFTSTTLFDTAVIPREQLHMPLIESEDTALWWTLLKSGITAYGLDELLVIYRRPAQSLSANKGRSVTRIWRLYREIAGLNVLSAAWHLIGWAWRATIRRLVPDRHS